MDSKKIQVYVLIFAGISAGVAAATYYSTRVKRKLDEDVAYLDKQIKQLELQDRMAKTRLPV